VTTMPGAGKIVKPFYNPPSLVFKQAFMAAYFAYLLPWKHLPAWLMQGKKTLPSAAGATGMGCIGYPIHPVWEITNACNLRCGQCHAESGKAWEQELDLQESKRLLDQMAEIEEFRMLALSGGEPMKRPDIMDIISHARKLGLEISIATNGTLITRDVAKDLKKMGVVNLAIGLNAFDEKIHESITRVPGSFERTLEAIYATVAEGMNLQINTTVMKDNIDAIPGLIDFASRVGAQIILLYHIIPQGRGSEEMELNARGIKESLQQISKKQEDCKAIIEPVCLPQYWPYLLSRRQNGGRNNGSIKGLATAESVFKGCVAGSGLCYVKPDGQVWSCPFVPVSAGNVREKPLREIWEQAELFCNLRDRDKLKGKCGACLYKNICGGCRGRAYSYSGDYLDEDPACLLYREQTEKH